MKHFHFTPPAVPTLPAQVASTTTDVVPAVTTTASVSGGNNLQTTDNHANGSDFKDANLPEAGLASTDRVKLGRVPNPGEVEWDLADLQADRDLEGKTNIRRLDFSVKPPGEDNSTTQVGLVTFTQQSLCWFVCYLCISLYSCEIVSADFIQGMSSGELA